MIEHIKVQYIGKSTQVFQKKYGTIFPNDIFDMEIGDYRDLQGDPNWIKYIEPVSEKQAISEEVVEEWIQEEIQEDVEESPQDFIEALSIVEEPKTNKRTKRK